MRIAWLLLLAGTVAGCGGTTPVRVPSPGNLVRVSSEHHGMEEEEATVIRFDDQKLVVSLDGAPRELLLSDVDRVRLRTGRGGNATLGAWIGCLLGVAVGAGVAVAMVEKYGTSGDYPGAHLVGFLSVAPGALLGAAVGSTIHSDKWEVVYPPRSGESRATELELWDTDGSTDY